jgi:hypothetical protein
MPNKYGGNRWERDRFARFHSFLPSQGESGNSGEKYEWLAFEMRLREIQKIKRQL